jgi:hypothetical protein
MKGKTVVTYGITVLFLAGLVFLFSQAFDGLAPPLTTTESFSEALWGTWGAVIVVFSS